jgi:hypothetical protein
MRAVRHGAQTNDSIGRMPPRKSAFVQESGVQ